MILEFNNKQQIEVLTILGGPGIVEGIVRDVLTIEIDPNTNSLENLRKICEIESNLINLYTYEEERNENDDIFENKIFIGEGYTIVLGIQEVTRKVNPFPGKIVPEQHERIYQVQLAQMTYDEWTKYGYTSTN